MEHGWVSLAENPTVEILLGLVAELQQRVLELEADMVTLKTERDSWTSTVDVPADLWKLDREECAMTVHYQNPYLPHTLRGATPPPAKAVANTAPPITKDIEGLPVGTAAQVMTWVGDDPDRAQAFLVKEQRESRPRVSLVANLKAVLKRHEIVPEPPGQLATQIDVIPAERAEYAVVDEDPVNQLEIIRERLQREQE